MLSVTSVIKGADEHLVKRVKCRSGDVHQLPLLSTFYDAKAVVGLLGIEQLAHTTTAARDKITAAV